MEKEDARLCLALLAAVGIAWESPSNTFEQQSATVAFAEPTARVQGVYPNALTLANVLFNPIRAKSTASSR